MRLVVSLIVLISYVVLGVIANTKYVKILPSDARVKPRQRIQIPTIFAKKYWISGTFFNKENFQGLPMSFYFTGSKCINFPHLKTLSSLKPIGCVMLYKSKDCQGAYALVSDDMADLNEIGMHDSIGSMKSCPPVDDSWRPRYHHQQNSPPSPNILASDSNNIVVEHSSNTNSTTTTTTATTTIPTTLPTTTTTATPTSSEPLIK